MIKLFSSAYTILPVVVSGNGKNVIYAPVARYVGADFSTSFQLLLNVLYDPWIIDLRISCYNLVAYADLIGLVFTCIQFHIYSILILNHKFLLFYSFYKCSWNICG